jgi:hypothetical protein
MVLLPKAIKCAITTVPSYAVLTRENDGMTKDRDVDNMLSSLDKLFGLDETSVLPIPPFNIYHPFGGRADVIFPVSLFVNYDISIPYVKKFFLNRKERVA